METSSNEAWMPAANPWLVALAVMSATFMEVLDTSVANVSLNHIAGNLSASTDEATWVLTSYLVSNAIVLPATGWLGRYFGRKQFLITCIGVFTVASMLCGFANSLGMLIFARILQGAGGGALQPMAQAILLETFPKEKRGAAMSVYAMGIVVAPILGPTLGGWITDNYSWRWVFFINLPVGIISMLMCSSYVEDPPWLRNARPGRIDSIGFSLLILWVGSLQVVLDKGQNEDWFSSNLIVLLSALAALAFIAFVVWELRVDQPIVNLRVLKDRNLTIGALLLFLVGGVLYGTTSVLPLFMQNLLGWTATTAGMVMSPRGFGAIVGSIVAARVLANQKLDGRAWIACGFLLLAWTMFVLGGVNGQTDVAHLLFPIVISGFAITSIFVPMSTYSMATVPRESMSDATGLTSLLRNLGGSVGISLMTTMIARSSQAHQATLVSHLSPYEPTFAERLSQLAGALGGVNNPDAIQKAHAVIHRLLQAQSALLAYVDQFRILALVCVACAPLVFLFRRSSAKVDATAGAH
jgi:DHA2 family multidrug resistance protein